MAPIIIGMVSIAVETCILVFVANKLLEKRFRSVFIYTIFIGTQMIRRVLVDGNVWLGIVLVVLVHIVLLSICYKRDFKKKLSIFIIYSAMTMSCELVIAGIVTIAFGTALTFEAPAAVYTAYALHKIVLFAMALLFLRIHKRGFFIREWLKYLAIPTGIFMVIIWFLDISFENNADFGTIILLGVFGFLTCIFMIGFVQYKEKQKQTAKMLRLSEEHERHRKHYSEDKAVMVRRHDRLAHDMRHHFESVSAMNDINDVREYAARIMKLSTFSMKITGNEDIDCILWPKQQRAEEKKIAFSVSGLLPEYIDFLDRYDIVSIIGNGLDNAIDACENVEGAKRMISVSFRYDRNLCIQIDNPYSQAPVEKKNGWFKSTKSEPGHGIGMESIQASVDKYHGHMETVTENGIFSLQILLQNTETEYNNMSCAPAGAQ